MLRHARTLFKNLVIFASLFSTIAAPISYAKQAPSIPDAAQHTLPKVKSKIFDEFYLASHVKLTDYKKVYIEEVSANFDKAWLRDNRFEADKRYLERVLERYPALFKEILENAIEKNNHLSLAREASEGTLTLSITLNDLEIYAPDSRNPSKKQLVKNAGRAELIADIKRASGNLLAQVKDKRETRDRQPNTVELTNALLNERDFKSLMKVWSRRLIEHIEKN